MSDTLMRIIEVARESPIVYVGYQSYLRGDVDKEEMLILCVEALAKESKAYYDVAVNTLNNRVSPPSILMASPQRTSDE
ncbi:hypothetical protein LCGC14_1864700 [marine sediment metagenome]|uniref:Uncharacterized protein n=1 Tax=marine sediment metagenome TaxID=412755 RepID=A0A0F9J5F3_9ZZZZ